LGEASSSPSLVGACHPPHPPRQSSPHKGPSTWRGGSFISWLLWCRLSNGQFFLQTSIITYFDDHARENTWNPSIAFSRYNAQAEPILYVIQKPDGKYVNVSRLFRLFDCRILEMWRNREKNLTRFKYMFYCAT
jgi:hypothetical protein